MLLILKLKTLHHFFTFSLFHLAYFCLLEQNLAHLLPFYLLWLNLLKILLPPYFSPFSFLLFQISSLEILLEYRVFHLFLFFKCRFKYLFLWHIWLENISKIVLKKIHFSFWVWQFSSWVPQPKQRNRFLYLCL